MIKDKLHIFKDTKTLSEGFTNFLLSDVVSDNKKVSLSLSGGTTPKVLFDYWSDKYAEIIPWQNFNLFWGDERCVPPDDPMSNYGMTKKHLLDKVNIPTDTVYRVHGESASEKEALRYGKVLNASVPSVNDIPEIDLIILGLGDDGHTASIFPHQIKLWDSNSNCVVAQHPESGMERVSITGRVINNAKHIAFLVTGENKAEKIRDIIKTRTQFLDLYPAARVSPKNQQIHWFLDESAASLL